MMKKYLCVITMVLISASARADFWTNCTNNGGTIIQANSYGNDKGGYCNDPNDSTKTNNCNGKRFCRGPQTNWWSAFTWCESVGGHLASFEHMCPGSQPLANLNQSNACPNLSKVGSGIWVSTRMGRNDWGFFCVNLATGAIGGNAPSDERSLNSFFYTFCEE